MQSAPVTVTCEPPEHGRLSLRLTVLGRVIEIDASDVPHNPVQDLAIALREERSFHHAHHRPSLLDKAGASAVERSAAFCADNLRAFRVQLDHQSTQRRVIDAAVRLEHRNPCTQAPGRAGRIPLHVAGMAARIRRHGGQVDGIAVRPECRYPQQRRTGSCIGGRRAVNLGSGLGVLGLDESRQQPQNGNNVAFHRQIREGFDK